MSCLRVMLLRRMEHSQSSKMRDMDIWNVNEGSGKTDEEMFDVCLVINLQVGLATDLNR
eukprot:CAMPEP_0167803638 /NCGR_PEP_ID=MMETSP0111_2-20121227/19963_1 /TAXON_ID=91324 /ORGANISM="Lotharella globosa, Strain CCCM811" /LENGTH=58 /DNA_ID=CAMNT_0007700161 /DNA_START=391 /DNA_END=563 /DNA_ORIENTATION=+